MAEATLANGLDRFPTIKVRADECLWGIFVSYTGPIDDLVQAGCISDEMGKLCWMKHKAGGKKMVDEYGDRFFRKWRSIRTAPGRAQIDRYIHDVDRAMALPGVRESIIRWRPLDALQAEAEAKANALVRKMRLERDTAREAPCAIAPKPSHLRLVWVNPKVVAHG